MLCDDAIRDLTFDETTKLNTYNLRMIKENESNDELYKYQPSNLFFRNIQTIIKENTIVTNIEKSDMKFVSFYSPSGGVGKTKNAQKCARLLSNYDKTFYLNLEMFSNMERDEEGKMNLLRALYSAENITKEMFEEDTIKKGKNLYMFYPMNNPYDLISVSKISFNKLLEKISSFGFKFVVFDFDSRLDHITLDALTKSNIVFLINDNTNKVEKFNNMILQTSSLLNIKNKIVELDNNDKKNLEKINRAIGSIC
ncbi:MAG: hypothetical protein MJ246_00455 [Clostridia bacterium]|nr:hypothetical protein [Clostridia bacterium]